MITKFKNEPERQTNKEIILFKFLCYVKVNGEPEDK